MWIRPAREVREADVTPEAVYRERRRFMQQGLALAGGVALGDWALAKSTDDRAALDFRGGPFSTEEKQTPLEDITDYANFYEFGARKTDPARKSKSFKPRPWSVAVGGEAEVTGTFTLEDILKPHPLEERIYRLRCVETWSMVIPWIGFPLADFIKRFRPTAQAKYVVFKTLHDPKQMPGQRRKVLDWPYTEALRMDEALHPLSLLAVGLYGKVLPNANGAPLRLVVPWKYGFKSIKSIAEIEFVERFPVTTWHQMLPEEYGFYANVNPEVDHPRWSQRRERRIGEWRRRETEPFNGYAEQVADLYRGMDLAKHF